MFVKVRPGRQAQRTFDLPTYRLFGTTQVPLHQGANVGLIRRWQGSLAPGQVPRPNLVPPQQGTRDEHEQADPVDD